MMKLVRYLGDGHALVTWPEDDDELSRMLPVDMFWFTEGLYVIGAGPGCGHLLGAQVEKIGGLAIDEAMAALDPVMPRDNEHWLRWTFPRLVRYLAVLEGLGIDHALTVRLSGGTVDEARLDATPIWHRVATYPAGWVALPDTVTAPLPLHLRNRDLLFWFEYLPAGDLVYFQFNAVLDHPAETFAAFCDRLFGFIEDRNAGRLVIDMRWNDGGNTALARHLLHHLITSKRLRRRGALFVIIGRMTFSAAQNTVTAIERETSAIFVGEPTGSRPNFNGERIDFELPYSKVRQTPPTCTGRHPGPRTTGPGSHRISTPRRRSRLTAGTRIPRWTPSSQSESIYPASRRRPGGAGLVAAGRRCWPGTMALG